MEGWASTARMSFGLDIIWDSWFRSGKNHHGSGYKTSWLSYLPEIIKEADRPQTPSTPSQSDLSSRSPSHGGPGVAENRRDLPRGDRWASPKGLEKTLAFISTSFCASGLLKHCDSKRWGIAGMSPIFWFEWMTGWMVTSLRWDTEDVWLLSRTGER